VLIILSQATVFDSDTYQDERAFLKHKFLIPGITYNDLHAALGRVKFDKILISQYTILFGIHQLIQNILVVVTDITIPKDCISIEWHAHFIP
jgi:hypothetical protein